MREILFRGKRVDNGELVYGLICRVGDKYANIVEKSTEVMCTVLTNTIGQFTGLTDKNGKKIFEGDIIKICGQHSCFNKVEFLDGLAGFYAVNDDIHIPAELVTLKKNFIEVIGNIHDNPEMLEVAE